MRHGVQAAASVVLMLVMAISVAGQASAMTLEQVRLRGELNCGVSSEAPGFSRPDPGGDWHGLNVDICRAVAAAVLGDATKTRFVPLNETDSVTAILSGDVDLLAMNLEWTLSSDTLIGLNFAGISFYDGQGFMVPVALGVQSAMELNKASVCTEHADADTSSLKIFFGTHGLEYKIIKPSRTRSLIAEIESGKCPVVSGDVSRMVALRLQLSSPERYAILPELISRRPLGPVVRQGDDGWFNIIRWVLFGLFIAEEKGVTSDSIDQAQNREDPEIAALLGLKPGIGKGLGLTDKWLYEMIRQVGNYGEIFDRNLGQGSELHLDRTINAPWNRGGLHYGASLR